MAKVTIQGKEYELRMYLGVMEALEEENGGLKGAMNAAKAGKIKIIRRVFAIMANSARHYRKQPEDIDGSELTHATMAEISALSEAIIEAQKESVRTETVGGAADHDHRDGYLDRIEAEERKNGETGES